MNEKPGNLAEVRRQLSVGDIVDDYASPLCAELVPNVSPNWHPIETYPNSERKAASHLIARRFGIFVPEKEEKIVSRGRKLDRTILMFPGYIFVFVWDILAHKRRIESVPGVSRIMYVETAAGRKLPAVISDAMIDEIRAVENRERPLPEVMIPEELVPPKKKGRWTKKEKRAYELRRAEWERGNEIVACRSWSVFQDGLLTLDGEGRNQTLRKALELAA